MARSSRVYVVKLQRGINNVPDPRMSILIYSRDRDIVVQQEETPDVRALFPPGVNEVYFNCLLSSRARLMIGEPAQPEEF